MNISVFLHQYHTRQTAISYLRAIDHFLFHSVMKERSSYMDIVHYLSDYNFKSPRIVSAIKRYFDYLLEFGKRNDHPCKTLVVKKKTKYIQFQELFTKDELESLLNREVRYQVLAERNKAIISLLIYQGLTSGNIENLRVKDINLDLGTIYIKATPKLSRRTLELKPSQVILFYRYINTSRSQLEKKHSDMLFLAKLGGDFSVDSLNRMLRPLQIHFPTKNLNAQTIRQSVICNWLNEDNIPLEDVQLLSGQKWMSSTEKYIRPKTEEKRGVINQFFPI